MMRQLLSFLLISTLAIPAATTPAAAAESQVLVMAQNMGEVDATVRSKLETDGIRLTIRKFGDPISLDMLKLFEAVVVPDFAGLVTPHFVPTQFVQEHENARRNIAELHRYVEQGGGLFFSPLMAGGGAEVTEGCEAFLAPWGASLMTAQVRDEASQSTNLPYALTTAIRKSPITRNVKQLWYPVNMLRWDDAYATVPFVFSDKSWDVVVRGMPKSRAAQGWQYTQWLPLPKTDAPAIAAIRTVGKGRVAVLGIAPFFTFSTGYAPTPNGWIGESHTGPVNGIFLEKGDGTRSSDGLVLLRDALKWLAEGARAAGLGGYTEERMAAQPKPEKAALPGWLSGWRRDSGARPIRILIGPRSALSEGQGTVAEYADAARAAGYNVLVMTELFEQFKAENWPVLQESCRRASTNGLFVLPGFDLADPYQNRFLLIGPSSFPASFMLTPDGKAMAKTPYLSLGFGTHLTAIHRPGSTPLTHHLHKFFSGVSVYTYREGKMIDNGFLAYQWQVNNESSPIPLAIHELLSPAEVAAASTNGHQVFVMADTPANAAWYLRAGMAHFWESPSLFLVSSGPMVRTLQWGRIEATGGDLWPENERDLDWGRIEADASDPIQEVRLICNGDTERRWLPNTNVVNLTFSPTPSHLRWGFVHLRDSKGRTAITPQIRGGPAANYAWRCSDRQNFFGYAANYTGTILPDINPEIPVFGTDEGRGLWPRGRGPVRGENLAPLLEFPYASPAVTITDGWIDQRYWKAMWEDVAFDGKPSQGTSRSRVYDGHVRYYDFNLSKEYREKIQSRPLMVKEVSLRLRMSVSPETPLFPAFTSVKSKPSYGYTDPATGTAVAGVLSNGVIELPVGGYAGDFIALSPGLRVTADGKIGFAAPAPGSGPLPAGTSWSARYVRGTNDQVQSLREAMGLTAATPYRIQTSRGALRSLAYVANMAADKDAVAGTVDPAAASMPFAVPLFIESIHAYWPAAVVRPGADPVYFGVFEGRGMARLDVTKSGPFFAGNVVSAEDRELRIGLTEWSAASITLDLHNPTARPITTEVVTAPEVLNRLAFRQTVTIPAGTSLRAHAP